MIVPRLISVEWDLSYICNFSCLHCRNATSTGKYLDINDYINIIEQIAKIKPEFLTIGGGEPLLYPELYKLVSKAKELGIKPRILSNGWLVNKALIMKLVENGMWGISISLDGAKAETHDKIRGVKGSYDRVINALKLLTSLGVNSPVSMTVNAFNINEIEEEAELCYNLGVKNLGIRPMLPSGRGLKIYSELKMSDYRDVLTRTYALKLQYKGKMNVSSGDPLYNTIDQEYLKKAEQSNFKVLGGCDIGISMLRIDPEGNVSLCPLIPNLHVGNILHDDIKAIWEKNNVINAFRTREVLNGVCKDCKYKYICGGCRARAMNNGDIQGDDPICWNFEKAETSA
jgi:radical SAM protein with 4Fe4S-binding SPASM domain